MNQAFDIGVLSQNHTDIHMKYILSTFAAGIIAFFIWAQYGKESPANVCSGVTDGTWKGVLMSDSSNAKSDPCYEDVPALCEVEIKVKSGTLTEVDSNGGKLIWRNKFAPPKLTDCGFARIITSEGNKFIVMHTW